MYQDGVSVRGYNKKRIHKRKCKNRYAKKFYPGPRFCSWNSIVIQYRDEEPWKYHPLNYWREYHLSKRRKEAKRMTNRSIRRYHNQMIHHYSHDDMSLPQRGGYQKYEDYWWYVW